MTASTYKSVEKKSPKNPSRYMLPQKSSPDRRRARAGTLEYQQQDFQFQPDDLPGHPTQEFHLPPHLASLPKTERAVLERKIRLRAQSLRLGLNASLVHLLNSARRLKSARAFKRLFRLIPTPLDQHHWRGEEDFAAQRLTGPNPMVIRKLQERLDPALTEAANRVLEPDDIDVAQALEQHRLFLTGYPYLADSRIQRQVAEKTSYLSWPTCLFFLDSREKLVPLAIRLEGTPEPGPVFTPLNDHSTWLLARFHAQSADLHYHTAIFHFLEVHMVCEVVWTAAQRRLHPDHPLAQLMAPHFEHALSSAQYLRSSAILGRNGLVSRTFAAGPGGLLDLARLAWSDWNYQERTLEADLKNRGVEDPKTLPGYLYRDDALAVKQALETYLEGVLSVWYRTNREVVEDYELQSWLQEIASPDGGAIPGFPSRVKTVPELISLATDLIFRASVQHAAVSNGQYDSFGFIPNASGTLFLPAPVGTAATAQRKPLDPFQALPKVSGSLAQVKLFWLLSQPTQASLFRPHERPAFTADTAFDAYHAVGGLRRQLALVAHQLELRNQGLSRPYRTLIPWNIPTSLEI